MNFNTFLSCQNPFIYQDPKQFNGTGRPYGGMLIKKKSEKPSLFFVMCPRNVKKKLKDKDSQSGSELSGRDTGKPAAKRRGQAESRQVPKRAKMARNSSPAHSRTFQRARTNEASALMDTMCQNTIPPGYFISSMSYNACVPTGLHPVPLQEPQPPPFIPPPEFPAQSLQSSLNAQRLGFSPRINSPT